MNTYIIKDKPSRSLVVGSSSNIPLLVRWFLAVRVLCNINTVVVVLGGRYKLQMIHHYPGTKCPVHHFGRSSSWLLIKYAPLETRMLMFSRRTRLYHRQSLLPLSLAVVAISSLLSSIYFWQCFECLYHNDNDYFEVVFERDPVEKTEGLWLTSSLSLSIHPTCPCFCIRYSICSPFDQRTSPVAGSITVQVHIWPFGPACLGCTMQLSLLPYIWWQLPDSPRDG